MARTEDPAIFEKRKKDHIKWSLDNRSQAGLSPSEQISLAHDPLPEIDFDEISLKTFLKHFKNSKPLMVSSMTGGHSESTKVNRVLLEACAKREWIFATGSLRKELESIDEKNSDDEWSLLQKEFANTVDVIGNIGMAQVIEHSPEKIKNLCDHYNLKSIYVHLNPLQEVVQIEGTTNFKGGLSSLENLIKTLTIPVFLKETGSGFSERTFEKIKDLGISAIDVSGFGGTHWGRIEGLRSGKCSRSAKTAETFKDWGITTVESLINGFNILGDNHSTELWASGGLRSGLDAAVCFALGAKVCGFAKPFMEAALEGVDSVVELMDQTEHELKTAMFCSGSGSIKELVHRKVF